MLNLLQIHLDGFILITDGQRVGYPITKLGSKGIYVLIAQDALITLGYNTGGLDGVFGNLSKSATISFQKSKGLKEDGIIGNNTWRVLMSEVVGKGASDTTILK